MGIRLVTQVFIISLALSVYGNVAKPEKDGINQSHLKKAKKNAFLIKFDKLVAKYESGKTKLSKKEFQGIFVYFYI